MAEIGPWRRTVKTRRTFSCPVNWTVKRSLQWCLTNDHRSLIILRGPWTRTRFSGKTYWAACTTEHDSPWHVHLYCREIAGGLSWDWPAPDPSISGKHIKAHNASTGMEWKCISAFRNVISVGMLPLFSHYTLNCTIRLHACSRFISQAQGNIIRISSHCVLHWWVEWLPVPVLRLLLTVESSCQVWVWPSWANSFPLWFTARINSWRAHMHEHVMSCNCTLLWTDSI